MKKILLFFALVLVSGLQLVMAQTTAKGVVYDENKEPMPGASVRVAGTTTGTITDVDGNFEVIVPEGVRGVLEIDYAGYGRQTVNAAEGLVVNMSISGTELSNVVIEATYGQTTTKEKYVGAADRIDAERISKMPVTDITRAIEGAAPGIQVSSATGQPGSGSSVRMRGMGSLSSSNSPLYVVDGTPYMGDITSIAPSDVESITLLKDATATSLYGSRGANGVIVITTKKGRRGNAPPRINVDAKVGIVQRGLPNYDVVRDPKDYYELAWKAYYNQLNNSFINDFKENNPNATEAQLNARLDGWKDTARQMASGLLQGGGIVGRLGWRYNPYDVEDHQLLDTLGRLNPNANLKYPTQDLFKELQRTGLRQDYNLNVSGGSEKSDYFLSFGYLNEKGYIKFSEYDRFSLRANVNTQITDWLRSGVNVAGSMSNMRYNGGEGGAANTGNPFYIANSMAPIYPVYFRDENGNEVIDPVTGEKKYDWGDMVRDPGSSIGTRLTNPGTNALGSLYFDEDRYKVNNVVATAFMEAKFLKDFSFKTTLSGNYVGTNQTNWGSKLHGSAIGLGGSLFKVAQNDFTYTWNQQLSWSKQFDKHTLSAFVVHENYAYNSAYQTGNKTGFISDEFRDLAVGTTVVSTTSRTNLDRIESYLGGINYDFADKYTFNANFRRDGSSRFAPQSRWGNFWSVGGAWHLSKENFLSDVSWLDLLKVKVSYGTQGNNQLLLAGAQNYYPSLGLYDLSQSNGANVAAIPTSLSNAELKWESSGQLNAGLEFSFFKRISGEINFFNRTNTDLLYNRPFPRSTGFATRPENVASMYNRGVELNMSVVAAQAKDFRWDVNFNLTKFKNVVTKLAPGLDSVITGNKMLKPGTSMYEFYLVQSAGVDPSNGDELYYYYNEDGEWTTTNVFADANVTKNRKLSGSSLPDLMGGMTNTVSYKGFELSFLFTFGLGGKFYDGQYASLMSSGGAIGATNWHKDMLDSWTPQNTSASLPRLEYNNPNLAGASTRFLMDASYLSLRNINLGYQFSENMLKKAHMRSLRAYVSVDNAFLMSKRKGMNPQSSFDGNDSYIYSPSRVIMFGVNVGL